MVFRMGLNKFSIVVDFIPSNKSIELNSKDISIGPVRTHLEIMRKRERKRVYVNTTSEKYNMKC